MIKVGFKRLNKSAIIPSKAHPTDSGFDLYASKDVAIKPGETKVVPTGISVRLPEGYEAQIRPRSGVTAKTKLRVQLGTIDNGYTGELGIIVDNIGDNKSSLVHRGDRIAQLVIQPIPDVEAHEIVCNMDDTERGKGGFGSTGI